jgi:hypothetical protein
MKKLLAVVAVVAFCASFTSCKKDCICKWSGDNVPAEIQGEYNLGSMSKSDCDDKLPSMEMPGLTYKCESK